MRSFTWAAAKPQVIAFEIELPGEGEMVLELRAITSAEVRIAQEKAGPRPTPPVTDFKKDADGKPFPVYNYEDETYRDALEAWNRRRMHAMLLVTWAGEPIPGDDEETQMAFLESDAITAVARAALYRAVNTLLMIGEDSVRMRPFHADRKTDA